MKESGCGSGSTMEATEKLRQWLAYIAKKYRVQFVNDCGCGDRVWVAQVRWDVAYTGYDVQHYFGVEQLDITKERTRDADLILCKDVFRHLSNDDVLAALKLFAEAAPLLVADSDLVEGTNGELGKGNRWPARPVDLRDEPFSLGQPIESINGAGHKMFGLWRLRHE